MRYLALIGIVTLVFFVVYGIFAWVDRNRKRVSKRKVHKPRSIGYHPAWVSYEYKNKPELEEFEAMEKVNRNE